MKEFKGIGITLFFILIPFAYFIQVVSGKPELVAAIYLILLSEIFYQDNKFIINYKFDGIFTKKSKYLLALLLLFIVAHHGIAIIYESMYGDKSYAIRGFFIYFIPYLIILFVFKSDELIFRIIKIISIIGVIVAIELTYENYNIYILKRTTWFQFMNRDYVYSITGIDMVRFYEGNYRPTGLLEHVHCSVLFVGIASIAWLVSFFKEKKIISLIAFAFCVAVVAIHGARLAFLASVIGIMFFLFIEYKHSKINLYNIYLALIVFILTLITVLYSDPFGTIKLYYLSAIFHGDYGIVDNGTPISINNMEIKNFFSNSSIGLLLSGNNINLNVIANALLGFGIIGSLRGVTGTSDDAFYLQLLGQYGLLGSLLFFSMWIYSIFFSYKNIDKINNREKLLINYAVSILVILLLSIIHSPALQRKVIYPIFIFSLAIVFNQKFKRYSISESTSDKDNLEKNDKK